MFFLKTLVCQNILKILKVGFSQVFCSSTQAKQVVLSKQNHVDDNGNNEDDDDDCEEPLMIENGEALSSPVVGASPARKKVKSVSRAQPVYLRTGMLPPPPPSPGPSPSAHALSTTVPCGPRFFVQIVAQGGGHLLEGSLTCKWRALRPRRRDLNRSARRMLPVSF